MKKKISALKIKHLISTSFSVLLIILFVLGVTSITNMQKISNNTEILYDRPHTNLVGMWEAKSRISQTGNGLREAILYGTPLSAELTANLTDVEQKLRDIEGNKVDKTAPMSDNMKKILEAVKAWSDSGQGILDQIKAGQTPSREEMELYTKREQEAVTFVDSIIVTAAENALKFKNNAMDSASSSTVMMCVIFAVALAITILLMGVMRKRIISPIYVILNCAEKIEQGELNNEIPYSSRDEFGELAETFRQMQKFLTCFSKKSPTSKVGDELRPKPLGKYTRICYHIISRKEKEVDYT